MSVTISPRLQHSEQAPLHPSRSTTGIIRRIEPTGVVIAYDPQAKKVAYIKAGVPITGCEEITAGMRLGLEVEDHDEILMVTKAWVLPS